MKKKKNNKHKISEKKPPGNQSLNLPPKSHSQLTVVSHQGYDLVSTNLPNNFFEGLLIKEMELNNAFTMDKLLELVNQYSLAIEYYLQIDPIKAKAYQIRMEYLLTNKDTLVQLSRHTHGKVDENEKNQKNKAVKAGKDFNKTKQYVKLKQEDLKYQDISKQVNTVLNKGNKKDDEKKNVKTLINDDIKKQDESWKEKFKNKKKNSINKSSIGGNLSMSKKFSFDKSLDLSKGGSLKLFPKNNEHNNLKNEIINDNKDEEIKEVNEEISKNNIIEGKEDINDENNIIEGKKDINNGNNIIEGKKENNKDKMEEFNIIEEEKKEENENKEEEIKKEKEENKEEIKEENNKVVEKKEEDGNKEDNLESIINKIMREQEEEEEEDDNKKEESKEEKKENLIENQKKEIKKEEEDLIYNKIIENPEPKELPPIMTRTSIVDEDMIKKMEPDEEISKAIKEQIQSLKDIISNLNKPKSQKDNINDNDNDNEEDEDEESNKNSEYSNSNSNLNKISLKNEKNDDGSELIDKNIDKIPAKFRSTYYQVESLMIDYMNNFHEYFYQDVFEQFSSGLRELYELKYKKYIEIRNEYHNQIKENEYLLENDENLKEEKKLEIQQTIESLNEEQQHQIDTIEDEFNRKIMDKISEFRLNSSKSNSGIQLLEERIKLDIYSLINESFY